MIQVGDFVVVLKNINVIDEPLAVAGSKGFVKRILFVAKSDKSIYQVEFDDVVTGHYFANEIRSCWRKRKPYRKI